MIYIKKNLSQGWMATQEEGEQAQEAVWLLVPNPLRHLRWGKGCSGSERVLIVVKSVNSGSKS